MSEPRIGELFAGYGGLGMGVQAVYGGSIAWVSDIDKGANKILSHRFPGVPNHGDITTIDWSSVEPVDILTGGSPCQDLSHAGKRQGMTEGTRSNLWVAMREAIAQLRPRMVVWENVRGAYSAAADSEVEPCAGCVGDGSGVHLRALGRVLGDLSDLGYDTRWHGLRAADVGAAHGRFRVFVVATDTRNAAYDWERACAESRQGSQVAALAANLGHEWTRRAWDGRTGSTDGDRGTLTLLPTPMVGSDSPAAHGQISGQYREAMSDALSRWGDYAAAIARWECITGQAAPEPTQVGSRGNPQLSARFTEWLMGLPSGWITDVPGITRNEALKACGNGVVPQQAAEALRVMESWAEVAA
ncbi:DNA cytosine methyltransferase [Nocardioides kribbensis]|uniref:Cytosine-specific methyltransferase n=1 Tax=Nocardioides kribbensis TaxID=305517 RepID=A0ABV1NYZ6_9ACTN